MWPLSPGRTRSSQPRWKADFWALEAGWCSVTSPGLGVDQPLVQVSTRNLCVPDQVTFLSKPVTRGRGERRLPASRQVSFPPSRAEAPSCVSHWTGAEPEGARGHTPKCMD